MSLLVLLPPSEGKSASLGASPSFASACPEYARDVRPVLKRLRGLKGDERIKCYGVSTAEKARAAHALNLAALDAPGMPAIERYTGVVYEHLDYAGLRDPAYARERLLIVSGLFGLLPAGAPIPDYKLPMSPWLAKHWRAINSARLAARADGALVVSLLPGAHAKALDFAPLITIDFKLQGGKASAGHFGKAIKGKFVRFLMENKVKDLSGIAKFNEDGYKFNGQHFVQQ